MKYLAAVMDMIVAILITFTSKASSYNSTAAGIIDLVAGYLVAIPIYL